MTKLFSVPLCDPPFSRHKAAENRKCTELYQIDVEQLKVKGTVGKLKIQHRGPVFVRFALRAPISRYVIFYSSALKYDVNHWKLDRKWQNSIFEMP